MAAETRTTILGIFICSVLHIGTGKTFIGAEEAHWRYFGIYGISNWSYVAEICDEDSQIAIKLQQSPINIDHSSTYFDPTLSEIGLVAERATNDVLIMINNGHTVNFAYNRSIVHLTGGNLNGTFRVAGVHFHWGSDNSFGSEHTINGKHYPIEMHIVTYDDSRYDGVLSASNGVNSISVLSVLFSLSEADNQALYPIVSHLRSVIRPGYPTTMQYFNLNTLLPSDTYNYYRYLGSLTTPPCSERVIWTVFQTPQTISSAQLAEFRRLQEMVEPDGTIDHLIDNWRPVQPLHGRKVMRSGSVYWRATSVPFLMLAMLCGILHLIAY